MPRDASRGDYLEIVLFSVDRDTHVFVGDGEAASDAVEATVEADQARRAAETKAAAAAVEDASRTRTLIGHPVVPRLHDYGDDDDDVVDKTIVEVWRPETTFVGPMLQPRLPARPKPGKVPK